MTSDASSTSRSDAEVTDQLPADLDLQALDYSEYVFPNNNRRRVPGALYVVLGTVALVAVSFFVSDRYHLRNGGMIAGAVALIVFGVYSIAAGWNLRYDERDALLAGIRVAQFPVGHASAQMGWRGLLSRPTWRILLYSNEAQPMYRGLVLVDGVDGDVLDVIIEENPEDWSAYDKSVVAGKSPTAALDDSDVVSDADGVS